MMMGIMADVEDGPERWWAKATIQGNGGGAGRLRPKKTSETDATCSGCVSAVDMGNTIP